MKWEWKQHLRFWVSGNYCIGIDSNGKFFCSCDGSVLDTCEDLHKAKELCKIHSERERKIEVGNLYTDLETGKKFRVVKIEDKEFFVDELVSLYPRTWNREAFNYLKLENQSSNY